jgi:hypothetical protein
MAAGFMGQQRRGAGAEFELVLMFSPKSHVALMNTGFGSDWGNKNLKEISL